MKKTAFLLLVTSTALAENNPYEKIGEGIDLVPVSSDSLINKVNKNISDISSLDTRVTATETTLNEHAASISYNSLDISNLRSDVDVNSRNITTNTTNTSGNSIAINELGGRVDIIEDKVSNPGGGTPTWSTIFKGNETGTINIPVDVLEVSVKYKQNNVANSNVELRLFGSEYGNYGAAKGEANAIGCILSETVDGGITYQNGLIKGYSETKATSCVYTYTCGESGQNTCTATKRGDVTIQAAIQEIRVLK